MQTKAKLIGKCPDRYNPYCTDLFYEYRGVEYMVTCYNNGYSESLREQHRLEQKRIDEILDKSAEPALPSGTVDAAIKELWETWEEPATQGNNHNEH